MGRLAVVLDWPYSLIPVSYAQSIFASDICNEKNRLFVRVASPHADIGGNRAIKYALDNGADEILIVSADQTVPPDILARFRKHNKPIVGALTASRSQAGHPWLLYEYTHDGRFVQTEPRTQLQRTGLVGIGCCLIKAWVFKKMKPPWFYTTATADGCDLLISNDFHFFADAAKAGIEVYCDTTVISEHQHEIALNAQSLGRNVSRLEVVDTGSAAEMAASGIFMPGGHDKAVVVA